MAIPQTAAFGKLFDLHFEIGISPGGGFYAKTVLGANALILESTGASPAAALDKIAKDMENNNFWPLIVANPSMASYPFGSAHSVKSQVATRKPDPNVVRKKPMELTQVAHPDCQVLCTSFDHFGKTKCKSMCGQRSGL